MYEDVLREFPCREPYCITTVRVEPGSVLVTITFTVVESDDASTNVREMKDLVEKAIANVGDSIFTISDPTDVNFEVTSPFLVVLLVDSGEPTRYNLVVSLLVVMSITFCAMALVIRARRFIERGTNISTPQQ